LTKLIFRLKTWILVLFFILIIANFIYYDYVKPNSIVNEDGLSDYSNTYLVEYNELIEHYFGHEQGYYFKFYGNYPYNITSIVSKQNGVAIEIIPSPVSSFVLKITTDKIENAIFENNLFNNPVVPILGEENSTVFNWNGPAGMAMFVFNNTYNTGMTNLVINTNQGHFIDFYESELLLRDMVIDNIYYPYVYLNGCDKKKCWTRELAKQRAFNDLREYGLSDGFIIAYNRNEFKEYFARPELESIIKDMVNRKRNDANYHSNQYETDVKNLNNIGISKYGVSNEFINNTINFINDKSTIRKELPIIGKEYENNWYYSGFFFILVILGLLIGFVVRKINIPPDLKESIQIITPLAIYFYSLQNTPFEYTIWQIILPFIPIFAYALYFNLKNVKHS
jgi:hypothetical protein